MKKKGRLWFFSLLLLVAVFYASTTQALTSPEQFLGHRVGADRKLAPYAKVNEYFKVLSRESDRVRLETVGTTTLGKPIIMAVVSSSANMARLDHHRDISRRLADPRKTDRETAERLIEQARIFVMLLCNQHSNEIASSNAAMELAYDLAEGSDSENERALEDVIVMIVPSANPDGQQMIVDYYNKYVGTQYEGGRLPWLYHHYAGHDNNRDWFFLNLAETDALVDVLYGDWHPQVLVDVHQMGSTGVRMFVPPFFGPPNPNNPPLIWNQIELLSTAMKYGLAEAGKTGVGSNAYYSAWYQGSVRPNATQHNITALLTENASVRIGTPIFIDPSELSGTEKGLPDYSPQLNFTEPWPGGWWHLRDIVEYQNISQKALIRASSKYRREFLSNFYGMAEDALSLSERGAPYAYLVPPDQIDPGSTARMLKIFERTRCEMHRAVVPFKVGARTYPEGTVVLKLDQPYGRFVKDLLERKEYPDVRKYQDGPPMPPYDNAGWTVGLMMGVEVIEVSQPLEARLELIVSDWQAPAAISVNSALLDCGDVNACRAVNRLLKEGAGIWRYSDKIEALGLQWEAGTFYIEAEPSLLSRTADSCKVNFRAVNSPPDGDRLKLEPGKTGLYRGWIPCADEGWTRLVLDRFEFDYERLTNQRIKKGKLNADYKVIVLPSLGAESIIKGAHLESDNAGLRNVPPEYREGIGEEGVNNLERFVRAGGTLVCLRSSCSLPVEEFKIPVRKDLKGVKREDFFCPGSLLRLTVDNKHPVGYGMPEEAAAFYSSGYPLATMIPGAIDTDRRVVARYPKQDLLLSGWIIGDKHLQGKPAVVDVKLGAGHIVLCGFGVQNRAQTYGTFKLLFNAIYR
jgi:Zinc carboxypeptidase